MAVKPSHYKSDHDELTEVAVGIEMDGGEAAVSTCGIDDNYLSPAAAREVIEMLTLAADDAERVNKSRPKKS